MTTQLDIANRALAHLAIGRPIAAMGEGTQAAKVMTQFYGQAREETLRDVNWPFARRYEALTEVAGAAPLDFAHAYRYPADAIAVRDVLVSSRRPLTTAAKVPYAIGSDTTGLLIFTDAAPASALPQVEYTVAVDEATWPADFQAAVSFRLAWYAAPALTAGDPYKLGDRALQAYQGVVAQAQATAENEQDEDLEVANLALLHLSVGRPTMTAADQGRARRAVRQFYVTAREEVFRVFAWPFARQFASLTLVAGSDTTRASTDFRYSYRVPADCLAARVLRAGPRRPDPTVSQTIFAPNFTPFLSPFPYPAFDERAARVPFIVGQDATGKLLFCDVAPIAANPGQGLAAFPELEYTARVDEGQWPADFTTALAYKLAWYAAPFVVEGDARGLRERVAREFALALQTARDNAWAEQEQDYGPEQEGDFLRSRY